MSVSCSQKHKITLAFVIKFDFMENFPFRIYIYLLNVRFYQFEKKGVFVKEKQVLFQQQIVKKFGYN